MPLPRVDLWARWQISRRAAHGCGERFREKRLLPARRAPGIVGGIHLRQSGGEAVAARGGVRAAPRQVHSLESAPAPLRPANRVRRSRELEADLRELLGVLSLPRRSSRPPETDALRSGGERSLRVT